MFKSRQCSRKAKGSGNNQDLTTCNKNRRQVPFKWKIPIGGIAPYSHCPRTSGTFRILRAAGDLEHDPHGTNTIERMPRSFRQFSTSQRFWSIIILAMCNKVRVRRSNRRQVTWESGGRAILYDNSQCSRASGNILIFATCNKK